MLLLVLFGIFYAFLFAGAFTYLIFIATPLTRPYALSAALWVSAFGSCLIGALVLGGLGAILQRFGAVKGYIPPNHLPNLEAMGWTYTVLALLGIIIVATGTALLHQILIHRLTFFVFRLYAAAISAGIGGTLACGLSFYMSMDDRPHWALTCILLAPILAALLGTFAFRTARTFRGSQPEHFPWVTREEFSGIPTA